MTNSMEFYQGDSSDIVSVSVYSAGVLVTDLDGYSGKFSVVKCVGDDPEYTPTNMTVVGTAFQDMISPSNSANLAPGKYIGVAEIKNDVLAFKKETHIEITVLKQGYTP